MSKYHQAADALKRYAVKYESLMAAAAELEALGSMDQAANESQAAVKAAKAELGELQEDIAKAKAEAKKQTDAGAQTIKRAALKAEEMVGQLVKDAEMKAIAILSDAKAQAGNELAAVATEKARLSSEIGGLQRAIEAAKTEVQALAANKERFETEAADAQKKLDKVQDQIRKLAAV